MTDLARCVRAGKGSRRPDATDPASQLRDLARKVERLGVSGRANPEAIIVAKFGVADELRQLARELAR